MRGTTRQQGFPAMSLPLESPNPDQHALSTRLVHAGLALSISTQLATSLIMQGPTDTTAGDAIFQLHRYSGFAALAFDYDEPTGR